MPEAYKAAATGATTALHKYAKPEVAVTDAREVVNNAVRTKTWSDEMSAALPRFIDETSASISPYGSAANVPNGMVSNTRNDMYLIGEALKLVEKQKPLPLQDAEMTAVKSYHKAIDNATKFISTWVKVAVALALGLGTMVGWKRIVVTVGEKIGKTHLTYGQGASAELVAMGTIFTADSLGLPVSTTHVLSSGVAGTMVANGSGLQMSTVRNLAMAWILTLPISIALSFTLFLILRHLI